MKSVLIALTSFALGAAAGYILASRKLVKEFDEKIQEELEKSKEDYINLAEDYNTSWEEEDIPYTPKDNVVEFDYTTMYKAKPKYEVILQDELPSVHDCIFLTLYSNGSLVDDATDELVHPSKTIGFDILRSFQNDSLPLVNDELYVRNLNNNKYYVVVKSDLPWSNEEPPNEIEEGGDKEV